MTDWLVDAILFMLALMAFTLVAGTWIVVIFAVIYEIVARVKGEEDDAEVIDPWNR